MYGNVSEYSNEGDAIQGRPKKNENKLAWTFTFTVNVIENKNYFFLKKDTCTDVSHHIL
jgi:hypothetical protein